MTGQRSGRKSETLLSGKAVFIAGLGAGAFFFLLEIVTALFGAETLLGPAYLMLREYLGVQDGLFPADMIVLTVLLHIVLSLLTTAVLGLVIHRWRTDLAVALGLVYGLSLYVINFIVFPFWLSGPMAGHPVIMAIEYPLYGMAAAWLYKRVQPGGSGKKTSEEW